VNDYPVAGHLQIRFAVVIYFGSGDRLAEFSFQLRFGESPFFGGGGLIRWLTGLRASLGRHCKPNCHLLSQVAVWLAHSPLTPTARVQLPVQHSRA